MDLQELERILSKSASSGKTGYIVSPSLGEVNSVSRNLDHPLTYCPGPLTRFAHSGRIHKEFGPDQSHLRQVPRLDAC